jgi:hypothetical protein
MAKKAFIILSPVALILVVGFLYIHKKDRVSTLPEPFSDFMLFEPEGENYVISNVTRIRFSPDKLYILDKRQKKVFVFSRSMSFLYTIGSPGQGPGDLEDPVDFDIRGDRIMILELSSRRLDIFNIDGTFIERTILRIPEDIFYSYPTSLLVDKENNYLVVYSLSAHLLDVFDSDGDFKKTLLSRDNPVIIYKKNIGNTSDIGFIHNGAILHFDVFEGKFIEVFQDGVIGRQFQIQDDLIHRAVQDLRQAITKESKSGPVQTDILSFLMFTNFCVDSEGWLYVSQMRKDQKKQKLWVFTESGNCRVSEIALPNEERVKSIYCWGDRFFFVSDEEKIWISKRRSI